MVRALTAESYGSLYRQTPPTGKPKKRLLGQVRDPSSTAQSRHLARPVGEPEVEHPFAQCNRGRVRGHKLPADVIGRSFALEVRVVSREEKSRYFHTVFATAGQLLQPRSISFNISMSQLSD
jgi:hypothetical protein